MPYVIVVYDVAQQRVNRVLNFLRQYLTWIQNSALEGSVTEAQLETICQGLRDRINEAEDSVYIFQFASERAFRRRILGRVKGSVETIL